MRPNGKKSFVLVLVFRHTGGRRYPSPPSSHQQTSPQPVSDTAHRTWIPAFAGMTDSTVTTVIKFVQAFTRNNTPRERGCRGRVSTPPAFVTFALFEVTHYLEGTLKWKS